MREKDIIERGEAVEIMSLTEGWKIIKKWLEEQSDPIRLLGANEDNFIAIKTEIKTYDSVLKKVEEIINAKNDEIENK